MNRQTRKVLWVERGIVYPSATEAAKQLDIAQGLVYRAANDQETVREGLTLRYVDGETRRRPGRPVVIVETGQVFCSVTAAAKHVDMTHGRLHNLIQRKRPIAPGVTMRFVDAVEPAAPEAPEAPVPPTPPAPPTQLELPAVDANPSDPLSLLVCSDGRMFSSLTEAAAACDVSPGDLAIAIIERHRLHGRRWTLICRPHTLDANNDFHLHAFVRQ